MTGGAGELTLRSLVKRFDGQVAVDGLDLQIGSGEFFSLLGASGCGKTTTLRMIAGFERPDEGAILLDGHDLVTVPPHKRPVNTVFQSYALFPFLSVRDNVAFGLRYREIDKEAARRRVDAALELVEMRALDRRRPHQLSGGQQQRVALARALVLEPTVLLLDEPMGALDAKLRKQLQVELRSIQREVGTTFVYVTHDQDEALTMSDRLAVLRDGRLMQVGTPSELYSQPANVYVASFLGSTNMYDAVVHTVGGSTVCCRVGTLNVEVDLDGRGAPAAGAQVCLVIRPERVAVLPPGEVSPSEVDRAAGAVSAPSGSAAAGRRHVNRFTATVDQLVFRGASTQVVLSVADVQVVAEMPNTLGQVPHWLAEGRQAEVVISPDAARLLPAT